MYESQQVSGPFTELPRQCTLLFVNPLPQILCLGDQASGILQVPHTNMCRDKCPVQIKPLLHQVIVTLQFSVDPFQCVLIDF